MIHRELHSMEKIGRVHSQYNMYRITRITLAWVLAMTTFFLIGCEESSSSPLSVASKTTKPLIIGNASVVSAEVGNKQAINSTRVLSSNSAFTCDANILEADSKKIREETGLIVSFEQSSKTVSVTGIANKSNVHDPAITSYSYDVVQCTITASSKKVKASIIIRTGLRTAPSGETSPTYYRPTGKTALKAIITAERGVGRQNTNSPNLNMIDTSAITDMKNLFKDDSTFNGDITQWNTSNVENMHSMFWGASVFNQNIGNWDTGEVTDMGGMFWRASIFNQNIGNWNTGEVTDMIGMFLEAIAFNQNIGNWNVKNVDASLRMFYNASKFDQDLSSWKWCRIPSFSFNVFRGSAMAGKTAQYPKVGSSCT